MKTKPTMVYVQFHGGPLHEICIQAPYGCIASLPFQWARGPGGIRALYEFPTLTDGYFVGMENAICTKCMSAQCEHME